MTRALVAAGLLTWVGATLLLSAWRRLCRPSLAERLLPYAPGGEARRPRAGVLSVGSLSELLGPLAAAVGDRVASLLGVNEALSLRLRRVHSPLDVPAFRVRQLGCCLAALLAGATVASLGVPIGAGLFLTAGAPLLAFLVFEQHVASASRRWQEQLARELPVVAEQLAALLNAGFSLGAAIARLAARGRGAAAADLAVVVNRVRQGVGEAAALREWAEVAGVDAVERLASVLSLSSEGADLGRLVSAEARQARRDLHRRTSALLEKRAEQVWVPVTVATLVPGAILLAVPFIAALRLFSST